MYAYNLSFLIFLYLYLYNNVQFSSDYKLVDKQTFSILSLTPFTLALPILSRVNVTARRRRENTIFFGGQSWAGNIPARLG